MTGWAALSGRIPKLKRGVKPPSTNIILETTGNVARLALDGTKESADAFPPLKSAVGGIIFFLDSFERLKVARENWTSLDSRASDAELLDGKTLPQELQNIFFGGAWGYFLIYDNIQSFVADAKAKAVDGQRRLKGPFSVVNLRTQEKKISSLQLELQEKLDKFEVTRRRLYDQLVLKNQLQHLQDLAEQSRQLQLSGDAINRIENYQYALPSRLQSIVRREFSGVGVGLRGLELAAAIMPLAKLSKNGSVNWRYGIGEHSSRSEFPVVFEMKLLSSKLLEKQGSGWVFFIA
ncbi:hypothetical protein BU17DRAFT_70520 [Hysterangium stoloniferum]|nr:hypothetical protein BU17DRAFT_70520 [Hysterangium stoloniferum]